MPKYNVKHLAIHFKCAHRSRHLSIINIELWIEYLDHNIVSNECLQTKPR